ncbi:hypothetical protein LMG3458_02047 [Achromobacter deleyi]|uniref:Uncharacterized protein n=1 Tax=Achromobacter deleyi TaxID=1353891 RepID=A0A6S6ZPY6_9BURK|nr:hypothetical protein [Achromobacter deleyi]CAB3689312.1 hypothetical protein LMG3458_02047 [Achromobacter deleyi]
MEEIVLTFSRKTGDVRVHNEGGSELDAGEVEQIIAALSALRERMQPPVPTAVPIGKPLQIAAFPAWWVQPDFADGSVVCYRHPGLGWMGFSINHVQAIDLARLLHQQNDPEQQLSTSRQ